MSSGVDNPSVTAVGDELAAVSDPRVPLILSETIKSSVRDLSEQIAETMSQKFEGFNALLAHLSSLTEALKSKTDNHPTDFYACNQAIVTSPDKSGRGDTLHMQGGTIPGG